MKNDKALNYTSSMIVGHMAACTSMGLAAGGMLPERGGLIANTFGLQSYSLAFGLMGPIITIYLS